MRRWEYHTTFLEADENIMPVPLKDDIPIADHAKFSPFTLIPQLNQLGAKGWELISFQPVVRGKNDDVLLPDSQGMRWSKTYLCAFRRPLDE